MVSILYKIKGLSPERKLLFFVITSVLIFVATNVLKIHLGHLVGILAAAAAVYLIYDDDTQSTDSRNKDMEYKLNSLLYDESSPPPDYFYIDPDFIELFYSIKDDFGVLNKDSYVKAIKVTNNLLQIRKQFEDYDLVNAAAMFPIAESQSKLGMNYLHSFIFSTGKTVSKVLYDKHEALLNRAHMLYKYNMDTIKDIYETKYTKDVNCDTKFITDYDQPKAYNKVIGIHNDTNFNFF